jgi:serine protease Do
MYRAFLLIACVCALAPDYRSTDKTALKDALAIEQAVQEVINQAEPSIACIIVSRSDVYQRVFQQPAPPSPGQLGSFDPGGTFQREESKRYDLADPSHVPEAYGSGVVIDNEAPLILTNYHVVRDATKIYVRLSGNKGSYADIHAADPRSDLAVLRLLEAKKLRPLQKLTFGDADSVRKGTFVVSLANLFAAGFRDGSPSASWGIVSNLRRRAAGNAEEEKYKIELHVHPILLQTDARLNLGCSGGALLNLKGELIGLTTARAAINGSEGAGGFAIPLDKNIQRIIALLQQGREVEYGFLGVGPERGIPRTEGLRRGDGFHVGDVTLGSPAYRAGVQPGDLVLSVNGVRVHDFEDLVLAVGTMMAGSKVDLELENHSRRRVPVTLAKFYVPGTIIASKRPHPVRGFRVDYTSVVAMKLNLEGHQAIIHPGVYVSELSTGSAAAKLKVGDIITQVKDIAVNTPDEFYREVHKVGPREPLWLNLLNSTEPVRID